MHQVYVYDVNTDHWNQLPPSGHYLGIPYIIGGKLVVIGGCLSATKTGTNKISTFDETSQTWTSYYPDLLSVRVKPGVITHLEHVIVAGGMKKRDILLMQDSIEVFNWTENSQWRMVSINLPVPMYSFTPIIAGDYYLIIGYIGANRISSCSVYKIPVRNITVSDQPQKRNKAAGWIVMSSPSHSGMAVVPKSFPPMVIGGVISGTVPTADIKIYDSTTGSWKNTALLSSARTGVSVATVSDNVIIVLGGCTSVANVKYSSLNIVELGQAQLK